MRFISLMLCAVLTCAAVGVAGAQSFKIGVEGGAGIPTGDYSDAANTGWLGTALATYMLDERFGVGVDLGYHNWAGSDDLNNVTDLLLGTSDAKWTWSAIQATAHGVLMVPLQSPARPWLRVGAGFYSVKLKLESAAGGGDTSKSKFGFNGGVGVDFVANESTTVGVGGMYHFIPTKDDLGADVSFFTIGAHVLFNIPMGAGK
jgi:opacity protein-like surface antigen